MAVRDDPVDMKSAESIGAEAYNKSAAVEWNGRKITVRRTLHISEMLQFVKEVTESCFASNTGEYLPEIMKFATKYAILEFYTDIKLPDDIGEKYDMIYCTDIMECVMPHICPIQIEEITNAIKEKVANRAQSNIEALTKQMNEVTASLSELEGNFSKIFSGIDGDTITSLAKAISNGDFSEEKILNAVIASRNQKVTGAVSESLIQGDLPESEIQQSQSPFRATCKSDGFATSV